MYDDADLARVRTVLLALAAAAWAVLLAQGGMMPMLTHRMPMLTHRMPMLTPHHAGGMSLRMFVAMNPPATLSAGWLLMLIAMMAPALIPPVRLLRARSFTQRRARATALFAAGYAAVWMAAGAALVAFALAI